MTIVLVPAFVLAFGTLGWPIAAAGGTSLAVVFANVSYWLRRFRARVADARVFGLVAGWGGLLGLIQIPLALTIAVWAFIVTRIDLAFGFWLVLLFGAMVLANPVHVLSAAEVPRRTVAIAAVPWAAATVACVGGFLARDPILNAAALSAYALTSAASYLVFAEAWRDLPSEDDQRR